MAGSKAFSTIDRAIADAFSLLLVYFIGAWRKMAQFLELAEFSFPFPAVVLFFGKT